MSREWIMVRPYRILFFIAVIVISLTGVKTSAADLDLDNQYGDKGDTVTFTVTIESAPDEVAALGFEARYDASVLNYSGYTAGSLVSGFDFFNANNASPGLVKVGGFEAGDDKISQGENGTVVSLDFTVVGHNDCQVRLASLKDNIKSWATENGQFTGDHLIESEPDSPVIDAEVNTTENRSDSYQPRSSQPDIKAVDSNPPVYSAPDRYAGNLPSSREELMIFRDESVGEGNIARKGEETDRAQQKSYHPQPALPLQGGGFGRGLKKEYHAASDVNNLPERSHTEAQSRPHFAEISDSKEVQTDGLRMLIVTMILFGSIYYIAIGLSILLAGCFFWELIKMRRRQIVARQVS